MPLNNYSAHGDDFARRNLPPCEEWPALLLAPPFDYQPRLNCATELLDKAGLRSERKDDWRRLYVVATASDGSTQPRASASRALRLSMRSVAKLPGSSMLTVTPSAAQKCERCWHYRDDVGSNPAHPTLCGRCDSNLHGAGEQRLAA